MSNEYYRNYRAAHKARKNQLCKESVLRCRYGLTPEQFKDLLNKQKNKCPVCDTQFSEENSPRIDHCHGSGWVRGLLCGTCNSGIGLLRDDAVMVQKAADYLISYAVPTEFNFYAHKESARKGWTEFTSEDLQRRKESMMGNTLSVGRSAWNKGNSLTAAHRAALCKPKTVCTKRGPMSESQKEAIRNTLKSKVTPELRETLRKQAILGAAVRWGKAANAKSGQ